MVSEWRDKWTIVVAALVVAMFVDGLLYSFGLFLVEFLDDMGEGRGSTAFIGSIGIGFYHFLAPISGYLVDKFGSRLLIIAGSLLSFAGFAASAYVNTVSIMCFTYGVLGGTGFGFMLLPSTTCVIKNFNKSRALACGIANCGSGLGTFVFNIVINYLISEFGWRKALLITAGMLLNGIPCGLLLVSSRTNNLTTTENHQGPKDNIRTSTWSSKGICISTFYGFKRMIKDTVCLLKDKNCLIMVVSSFCVGLALSVPFSLLPDEAIQSGMTRSDASWLVSSIGLASLFGRISFGWLGDKLALHRKAMFNCMLFVLGISMVILPLLPTFHTKLAMTCLFGISSGAFIVILPVILADEFGPEVIGKSYGIILFAVGTSSLFAAPLAGWIYDVSGNYNLSFFVPGLNCCVVAICILVWRIKNSLKGRYRTIITTTESLTTASALLDNR